LNWVDDVLSHYFTKEAGFQDVSGRGIKRSMGLLTVMRDGKKGMRKKEKTAIS
jgi:hypothetical protein